MRLAFFSSYQTLDAARAAAGPTSLAAESNGTAWLFTSLACLSLARREAVAGRGEVDVYNSTH